jgi:hypothetical protein
MNSPNKDKYGLHAVIIKKGDYDLENARRTAQEFIKDSKKKYYRETKASYRFRNISKQKFYPKSFRTKKVNKDVSIVFGILKPEWEHLEGEGLFDFFKKGVEKVKEFFKPRLDSYNNTSTNTINQYGDIPIKSLTIYRTPISSLLNTALNFISMGKWNELRQKYGFDQLFHLALVANVGIKNVIIEKNEAINVSTSYKTSKDTETFNIPLENKVITVREMLEKARKAVGDKTFFDYDAFTNNCQFFIRYLLESVGLYSEDAKKFLFQDIQKIYEQLPSYVPKIAKAVTTTGAIFNKITGQGNDEEVENSVKKAFPSLMGDKATKSFYEYVKKHSKDTDVGLYFIQQMYPKWLKSKEAKNILAEIEAEKPKGRKKMTEEQKKTKKSEYDKKRYANKKGIKGGKKPTLEITDQDYEDDSGYESSEY